MICWFIFFPQPKFIMMRGCAPQVKSLEPFFCNFVYFKSIGDKICILFTNGGRNMHPPPLFFIPFQSFLSPNLLFGHIFAFLSILLFDLWSNCNHLRKIMRKGGKNYKESLNPGLRGLTTEKSFYCVFPVYCPTKSLLNIKASLGRTQESKK